MKTWENKVHRLKQLATKVAYLESTDSILPGWCLEFPGLESWTCVTGKNLCQQSIYSKQV